jgi:hypothetical protein
MDYNRERMHLLFFWSFFKGRSAMVTFLAAVTISIAALNLYLAPLIPFATSFLTKLSAPGWIKTGVNVLVASIVTLIVTAIELNEDLIFTWDTLGRCAMTTGTAVVSYLVLRPAVDKVALKLGPSKGVG